MTWTNPAPPKAAVKLSDLPKEYQDQIAAQYSAKKKTKKKSTYKPAPISESKLQKICIKWFRLQYPHYIYSLYAIPNGGKRSIVTAVNMKAEGQLQGVWDLHLCVPKGKYAGLYIEMKVGKNDLTDDQKLFRDANKDNHMFVVCRTAEEFINAISSYLNIKA